MKNCYLLFQDNINEENNIIPYHKFYNYEVSQKIDLKQQYFQWKR